MKHSRALLMLLAVSLALNLAFLATGLLRRGRRPAPPPELRNDLALQPGQKDRVREILRKFKVNSLLFKEDILDKRVEIIEALGSPQADREAIAAQVEELNKLEGQLNRDFIAALLDISAVLDPGQRLDMIYRLGRNWFFFGGGPEKGGSHE